MPKIRSETRVYYTAVFGVFGPDFIGTLAFLVAAITWLVESDDRESK